MKNSFFLLVSLLTCILAFGQQVPNSDFSTWIDHGSYEEPEHWNTSNEALSIVLESTVFKSDDAYSGNYSAMLETRYLLGVQDVPGLITLADISIDLLTSNYSISGGMALNENVKKLTGMYKYSGVDNDSATVLIYNFKRDGASIDTIGYGTTYLHDASSWSPFTVTMVNQNSHVPDTFNVIILSSGSVFHSGSVLKIDSLAIETNTGIISLDSEKNRIITYPNPATDIITFETTSLSKERSIHIYDLSGNFIDEINFNNKTISYSISNLPTGNYIYRVYENESPWASGSFIKQ